jgi:ABC-type sugar transport system ATPase subunit
MTTAVATDTLVLDGIVKRFGSVTALRGASIAARKGEITAIVGDNGAGKSTLIKCLTGVHRPDEGRMTVDGKEVDFHTPEDSRRAGIEAVYQDLALADDLAVWQNLFLNREKTRGGRSRSGCSTGAACAARPTPWCGSCPSTSRPCARACGACRAASARRWRSAAPPGSAAGS